MGGQIRHGRIWRLWGAPVISHRGPQIPIFKGFWDLWTENRGAPKTPNSTPSECRETKPLAFFRVLPLCVEKQETRVRTGFCLSKIRMATPADRRGDFFVVGWRVWTVTNI